MTPLEAAEAIYRELDIDGPYQNEGRAMICRLCEVDLVQGYHYQDCPWLVMPDIIEQLGRLEGLCE